MPRQSSVVVILFEPFRQMGLRIKEARKAKGLNQDDLARLSGIHNQTVSRWERGERVPAGESLYRLAGVLGVRSEWLISGEGGMLVSPGAGVLPIAEVSKDLADRVAKFVIGYQELVGELSPAVEAALTVLLYRECELRGKTDPKELPQPELHMLIGKAVG